MHVLADAKGRLIGMFLPAGQTSDYIGARVLLSSFPQAKALLADRGYDADWFRNGLIDMGISPCIPSRAGRKVQVPHAAELYRQRHKIENMFARLKDWRRIATRYDRCPILFLCACALAATVIYWLLVLTIGQAQERYEKPQGSTDEEKGQPRMLPLPAVIIKNDIAADARQRREQKAEDREIQGNRVWPKRLLTV